MNSDISEDENLFGLETPGVRYTAPPTTGNDADIEDNLVPGPMDLRTQLRARPPLCKPTTPCRLASAREDFLKHRLLKLPSTAERLSQRPKSALESITDTIEKPERSVPPISLPAWHFLPLDHKIPRIPAPEGFLYYSPGKISSKLHRLPKVYSLADPHNRERVIGSPYTALHDPHAKEFINQSKTRRLLQSQGLINENDEIMYSLREFNKYRGYLKTLFNDDVHMSVHYADELWRKERSQMQTIQNYLSQTEGKAADRREKLNRSQRITTQIREYKISRLERKQRQTERRLTAWNREKDQTKYERIVRASERGRLHQEKLEALHHARTQAALKISHNVALKQYHSNNRRSLDTARLKTAHESFLYEWMNSKIANSNARLSREQRVNVSTRENIRRRAARRHRRMESHWTNLPGIIAAKKEKEAYRLSLAAKYFYLWLAITKRRMSLPFRDSTHESVWIKGISGTLDETVKYLRFQTDTYEKLDDFILNIIHLKQQIAKQLAKEEAEEVESADNDNVVAELKQTMENSFSSKGDKASDS